MRLEPYRSVDGVPFEIRPDELLRRHGRPPRGGPNGIGLDEWDYGSVVYRFQSSTGRLEEVTRRAPVLYLGTLDVPFAALERFVRSGDPEAFERAGFVVSPRWGLAFAPDCPDWVTALASHCIPTWRAL